MSGGATDPPTITTPSAALRKSLLFIVILVQRWFGDEAFLSFDSLALPSGRNWKVLYYTPINQFRVKHENTGEGKETALMGKWEVALCWSDGVVEHCIISNPKHHISGFQVSGVRKKTKN